MKAGRFTTIEKYDPACAQEENGIADDTNDDVEFSVFAEEVQTVPKRTHRTEHEFAERHHDNVGNQDQVRRAFQREVKCKLEILEVVFDFLHKFRFSLFFLAWPFAHTR